MGEIPLSTVILLVTLILLSAFFSSAETAFSSVNKIRLKNFMDEGRKGSKKAYYIAENFDKTLTTILIGNNIVNTAAASISAALATEVFGGNMALVISTVIMTILILIFGEILPKSFAKENAESLSLSIAGILLLLIKLFTPFNWFFIQLKGIVSKVFHQQDDLPTVTEDEIKVMLNIGEQEGVIDKEEWQLIHRSMNFDDTLTGEVLTPRIDMVTIDINASAEEVQNVFFKERFSRIPVYEEHIDQIVGILSDKEFYMHLLKYGEVNLREIIREPLFVVETMKISDLLPKLQKEKVHMAIVLDEYGGTAGLITLEDVLEELVGEIWDEQDEKITSMKQISDTVFKFNAQFPLDDFSYVLNIPRPESAYHTIGGWVIENFGIIPSQNDFFKYQDLKVSVEEVLNRRVTKVKVERIEEDNMNGD